MIEYAWIAPKGFVKLTKSNGDGIVANMRIHLITHCAETVTGGRTTFVGCWCSQTETAKNSKRRSCSFARRAVGGSGFPRRTRLRWLIIRCKEQQNQPCVG